MTFRRAVEYAQFKSERFKKHYEQTWDAILHGGQTPCYIFAIDGETFYYGYDGVDLHCGKHSKKRAAYLIEHGEADIL